ncbi:hypothetical protein ACS0TY_027279 [Phlomoides rotata]
MGVIKITQEFTSPIARDRVFKAVVLESNILLPKLLPQFFKSIDLLKGDGGVGSVEQVNFTESSQFKYMKNRLDELDKEKFMCKYTMIESDALGDKLDSIAYEMIFESSDDGGSVCKMTSEYRTLGGYEVKEEEIKAGKVSAMGIYKVVEAYLLENPNVYA